MEKVICDLCGADVPDVLLKRDDRFSGQEFTLVTCSRCGLIYLQSRPTQAELAQYYPSDYEAYYLINEKGKESSQWHIKRALKIQLNFVEKHSLHKGNLLDVGCATGNFLKVALENGWEVMGLEPIEKAANIAREYYHLNVITGTLESTHLEPGSLDVITMWDVLEHLPSPKNAFQKCQKLLAPDGFVIFSIPNLESFDRYFFGKHWIGWDAPRHFNLFTESTLNQLLAFTGFELVDKRCILGGKGTFLLSLDHVIGDGNAGSLIKKVYPVISALLWPYRQISYLINRGPIITYAVQKMTKM